MRVYYLNISEHKKKSIKCKFDILYLHICVGVTEIIIKQLKFSSFDKHLFIPLKICYHNNMQKLLLSQTNATYVVARRDEHIIYCIDTYIF